MSTGRWTLLLALLFFLGCNADASSTHFPGYGPPPDQDLSYDAFRVDTVTGTTILDSTHVENPYDLAVSAGRLFVLEQYPPPVLRVVEIGTWRVESRAGRQGQGPGEVMVPWRVFVGPNGAPWIYDSGQRRIVRLYQIDTTGALRPDEETINLESPFPIKSISWLTDTTLVANGFFDDERFGLFRADGKLLKHFGGVPEWPGPVALPFRNHFNEVEIAVHPSRELFVAAKRHTSEIEILDFDGKLKVLVKTPFDFRSSVNITSTGQGYGLSWDSSWRQGYIDVAATEDRIFALFSGRTLGRYGTDAAYGEYVHVFDWEGELHRILRLDMDAFALAVEKNNSVFYTVSYDDARPVVRRYELTSSGSLIVLSQ